MITNSTLKYGSEVFVNGFKNTMHAIFGIFWSGLKIGINVDVLKVFTCLGGG